MSIYSKKFLTQYHELNKLFEYKEVANYNDDNSATPFDNFTNAETHPNFNDELFPFGSYALSDTIENNNKFFYFYFDKDKQSISFYFFSLFNLVQYIYSLKVFNLKFRFEDNIKSVDFIFYEDFDLSNLSGSTPLKAISFLPFYNFNPKSWVYNSNGRNIIFKFDYNSKTLTISNQGEGNIIYPISLNGNGCKYSDGVFVNVDKHGDNWEVIYSFFSIFGNDFSNVIYGLRKGNQIIHLPEHFLSDKFSQID